MKQPQKQTVSCWFSWSPNCVCASNLNRAHCSRDRKTGFSVAMQCTVYISVRKAILSSCTYISRKLLSSPPADTHLSLPFSLHSIYNRIGSSLTCSLPFTAILFDCSRIDFSSRIAPASYYYREYWNIPGHYYVQFSWYLNFRQDIILA